MGCCGLFKSKKSKKSKNSQVQTQGFAPRPVQPVVQNGKYSYQPATDPHQQFNPQKGDRRAANRAMVGTAVRSSSPLPHPFLVYLSHDNGVVPCSRPLFEGESGDV